MSSSTESLPGKSDLLPRTRSGMPSKAGFSSSSLSSSLATGRASLSAESTMNLYGSAEVPSTCSTDLHYGIHTTAVPLPHGAESGLTPEVPTVVRGQQMNVDRVVCLHPGSVAQTGLVPQEVDLRDQGGTGKHSPLQGYMAFLDALHIEADGRDGAMAISALTNCDAGAHGCAQQRSRHAAVCATWSKY